MSDNQNCGISKYAKFDTMTTEELEEILRLDLIAPEGQGSDMETLLYVMEVLADRRKMNGHAENEALKAYESFKQNYMPEIQTAHKPVVKHTHSKLRWLRSLSAAAAVLVIILLGTVTAKAFGVDVWKAVITWTQETFHIGGSPHPDNGPNTDIDLQFTSLQEALTYADIHARLVPTHIPNGYNLTNVTVEQTPMQTVYNAIYHNGNKTLKITVRNHLTSTPEYIEQSEGFVGTYEADGITYHLFLNNLRTQAVWINGSYECYIFGDLTIDELKQMIDSI